MKGNGLGGCRMIPALHSWLCSMFVRSARRKFTRCQSLYTFTFMKFQVRKTPLRKAAALLLLTMMSVAGAWAQLVDGKVYNIVNHNSSNSLSSNANRGTGVSKTDRANYYQLWIAEAGKGEHQGKFALRNLGNGHYLRNSRKTSVAWTMVPDVFLDANCYNYCVQQAGSSNIYTMSDHVQGAGYNCMHISGSIVSWEFKHSASRWNIHEVAMSPEQIQAQLDKIVQIEEFNAGKYEVALAKIFTDKACTVLASNYAAMTDEQLAQDATFKQLSAALQQMVRKVKKADWTEDNQFSNKPQWDSEYAKKFRVQLYEPYSNPHEAGRALRIQPHSVMNNPTGIYAKKGDVFYVMVEGKIEEGSQLWFSTFKGYERPEGHAYKGHKLKEGLNIIRYNQDSLNTFICYTVETFMDRKPTGLKLSSYKDLKIHIEGGHINGYYNRMGDKLYTPDKNKDWEYYEARANMPAITILGKYQILHLYQDSMAVGGKKYPGLRSIMNEKVQVEDVIAAWDKLMMSERLTLGILSREEIEQAKKEFPTLDDPSRGIYTYMGNDSLAPVDYSDTYRVHGMAWGMLTGYMVGSNGYSGYHISTFPAITVGLASRTSMDIDNIWGPAHEIGHQHQELLHMNGLKESSNNIFSNVAVWFDGKATSRMSDGKLLNLLNIYNRDNGDFFHTTLGVQMHLYYKLWLYYHLAGKNNKFYPRLFEMLRKDPMGVTAPAQDGAKCLLHFYKMCSRAAGEDLTDFFRAHCFFTPMNQRFVADYTSSSYTLTQEQVDAAIAEVKSWNLPLNRHIILINDCAGKPTYSHDGKTLRLIQNGVQADLGMYTDFIHPEASPIAGSYTYRYANGKIEVSGGQGGVGFLAYDDEGMLQAFSDSYVFPLSERAAKKLSLHKLRIYAVDGAGQLTEISANDLIGTQRELLNTAIASTKKFLQQVDPQSRCVGFYRQEAVVKLNDLLVQAEEVYEQKTKEAYLPVYYQLMEEMARIKEAADSRITFVPNSEYLLECQHSPNKYIIIQPDGTLQMTADEKQASKWLFEQVGENAYYIKDPRTGKYMSAAETGKAVILVERSQAPTYRIETLDEQFFAYFAVGCDKGYLNYNGGKVLGWAKIEGTQSRWRFQLMSVQEAEQAYQELKVAADQAEALVREVTEMKEIVLQTQDCQATGFLYCNAAASDKPEVNGSAANGYHLLDNNINTFLFTEANGKIDSEDKLDHYLRVDLKEQSLPAVSMRYVTRNADGLERPKHILIEGSQDGSQFIPIQEVTKGLPNHPITTYETELLNANYRYLRLMVKATYGGNKSMNHPYFSLASFGVYKPELLARYTQASAELAVLYEALNAARSAMLTQKGDVHALRQAKDKLVQAYSAFAQVCEAVEQAEIAQKQKQLHELIQQTEKLIAEVGTVKYEVNRELFTYHPVALQATNEAKKGYVTSNADQNTGGGQTDGGGVAALFDKNVQTHFHSRWSGTVVHEAHHLLIKVADVATDAEFVLGYTTRNHSGGPFPQTIRLEQSLNGKDFTTIKEFTHTADALPQTHGKVWKSGKICPTDKYRYLRMVVTKSTVNKLFGGQYCFALAELAVDTCEYKTEVRASVNEGLNCVTAELLGAVDLTKLAAQSMAQLTVSEQILTDQLVQLQQMHDSLLKAKNASASYNALQAFSQTPYLPCYELTAGTKVGQWNAQGVEAYNQAYRQAAALLKNKGAAAQDYAEALKHWQEAVASLTVVHPEAGKFYTVRKADVKGNLFLYADANNVLQLSAEVDATQSRAAWQFVSEKGKLTMKSLHTTSYLPAVTDGQKLQTEVHAVYELKPLANDGKVAFATAASEPQGWYVEEIADPTQLGYDLTVSKYGYAGLYLDYAVQLPEGVQAYTVGEIKGSTVKLQLLAESVVPASTAVIVKAPAATYRLSYLANVPVGVGDNQLRGVSRTQFIQAENNHAYYLFGVKNEQVGLYKAWLEYNADGSITTGNQGTDHGGHFRVLANKVYLPLATSITGAPLSFRFDEVQTDIAHPTVTDEVQTIYDLQGRRIHRVRQSGLYIVNGQKVYLTAPSK